MLERLGSLLLVGCCIVVAGCDDEAGGYGGYVYDGPVNSCQSDDDCPEGSCHPDLGRCVVPAPTDGRTYHVKVIPQSELGVPSQVFQVTPDGYGNVPEPLVLQTPKLVQGATLALTSAETTVALKASVIFIDGGNQLPGRAARITVYESSSSVFDGLELLPSTYSIIAIPEGDQAASHAVTYWSGIAVDENGDLRDLLDEKMDLVVPLADVEVRGAIRQGGLEMNGLRVVAVDPATGRIASTEATSDCVDAPDEICGYFLIRLAPGVEEFSLEISRPAEPQHPVFTIPGFEVPEGADIVDLTEDPRLSLDPIGVPVRYHATVEKPVESSSGTILNDPAPGCFVLFESYDVAGGSVTRWVSTNEMGAIEESEGELGVNLYPGDYKVTVIPAEAPSDTLTDYTAFISPEPISISGPSEIGGQVFPLSFRPLFKGSVLAFGERVPQVTLVAQPHLGEADFPRSSTASTGFDGRYSLWLDPGTYRVLAEAPPESGFAWGSTLLEVDDNGSSDLGLPLPFAARLSLAPISDKVEVAGAVVEWYFVDTDGRAYTIARVAADADGVVTALLPP